MSTSTEKFISDVNLRLDQILSHANVDARAFDVQAENPLQEGFSYAVKDGGKRVRPLSVYFGALSTGKDIGEYESKALLDLASIVELVHSYSLVHDDLPAMDNDDYRRGKLSTHKKYGEANGILIGDGLLTLAMKTALNGEHGEGYLRGAKVLADGALNMVSGQAYDLSDGDKDYLVIYALKTAELISCSFMAGALCVGADDNTASRAKEFGHHLGLAFQLADDLLDDGTEISLTTKKGREYVSALLKEETDKAIALAQTLENSHQLIQFATKLFKRTK